MESALGYTFNNQDLLTRALTHSSYAHENGLGAAECNERLEFLGDAVLELTASEYLFNKYRDLSEGELTKYRAGLVCETSLAALARGVELGAHLRLGKGEELTGGRTRDALLADALEAVFGAVFLDGGIDSARGVILRLIANVEIDSANPINDYKTTLQEILQKDSRVQAVYSIVNEGGPQHQKTFTATVSHDGRLLGTGEGRNKKEAEQNAARDALKKL